MWLAALDFNVTGSQGVVGLFAVASFLVLALIRIMLSDGRRRDRRTADQAREIQALKDENVMCRQGQSMLITTMQRNGLTIPPEVWDYVVG